MSKANPDKYDKAIEFLAGHPDRLTPNWSNVSGKGSCLFQFIAPKGNISNQRTPEGRNCGCLTEIRGNYSMHAWTPALTAAIRADKDIPRNMHMFNEEFCNMTKPQRRKALAPLRKWQRKIDKLIRN